MIKLLSREIGPVIFETYDQKPKFTLSHVHQIHSNIVVPINLSHDASIQADGQVGKLPLAEPMAIITADCLPILLIGKTEVAFLHAGWRGLHNKIMFHDLVKKISPHRAYIGPHIMKCCFEVQPNFKSNFSNPDYYEMRNSKLYFDLTKLAKDQLNEFRTINQIEVEKTCTCCTKEFKSFRRDGTIDRNWNVIKNNQG
ncbi:MAG: peptidoglycan editing factor PgeF [Bacteriovoracaceae bacterium]